MSPSPYRTSPNGTPNSRTVREWPSRGFVGTVLALVTVASLDVVFAVGGRGVGSPSTSEGDAMRGGGVGSPSTSEGDAVPLCNLVERGRDVLLSEHLIAYDRIHDMFRPLETAAERPAQSMTRNCTPPYAVDPSTGKKRWRIECL
jgi:hypothetical protein